MFLLNKRAGLERASGQSALYLPQQNAKMWIDNVSEAPAQTLNRQQIHIYGRLRAWDS